MAFFFDSSYLYIVDRHALLVGWSGYEATAAAVPAISATDQIDPRVGFTTLSPWFASSLPDCHWPPVDP